MFEFVSKWNIAGVLNLISSQESYCIKILNINFLLIGFQANLCVINTKGDYEEFLVDKKLSWKLITIKRSMWAEKRVE